MCIALVGGMDRATRDYQRAAQLFGVDLHHFERDRPSMTQKLEGMDGIIIFTNRISHGARHKAVEKARNAGIPVLMCHSCGVSSLKRCLEGICLQVKSVQ